MALSPAGIEQTKSLLCQFDAGVRVLLFPPINHIQLSIFGDSTSNTVFNSKLSVYICIFIYFIC